MAIDHKFSNTSADSVLELFQTNTQFIVPRFQRNYSWSIDKVDTLWSDILENFHLYKNRPNNPSDSQYLLGPVVLTKGKKQLEFQIIDGQQRLSTITILFCVARDIILELVKPDDSNARPTGIDNINNLIENTHMGEHTTWKLVLNDTDRELFEEIQTYEENEQLSQIERIKKLKTKTPSENRLKKCYIFLYENLQKQLSTNFEYGVRHKEISEEELKDIQKKNIGMLNFFLQYVQQYNYVVKIMVADDSTAFQIFETLNERGQSLSRSNLIKNYVLNQINDEYKQRDLSDKWNKVFDTDIGDNQPDDEFILESLRSRHPNDTLYKLSTKNLYKIIKNQIKDEKTCKQYIKNIQDDAEFLAMLNTPCTYDVVDEKKSTIDDIRALKILNAKFMRTPILAAYRRWGTSHNDYKKLVPFLVKFFFKFRTIRQNHPGDVERIILNTTQSILDGRSASEIIKDLKKYDDHEDFNYHFKRYDKAGKDTAKYILQQITLHLGDQDTDVRPIDNLTLEHILPQKNQDWSAKEFFGSSHDSDKIDAYVDNLGNMTLLKNDTNVSAGNKPFEEKKKIYETSRLSINKKTVIIYDKWTKQVIDNRRKQFADYADEIWDLKSYY